MSDREFDLKELCDSAGVSARTVRYYIAQGILPPAHGTGPGAKKYGREHVSRLALAVRLRDREHQPLAEIRRALDSLDDDQVQEAIDRAKAIDAARAAEVGEPAGDRHSPALEYVQQLRRGGEPSGAGHADGTARTSHQQAQAGWQGSAVPGIHSAYLPAGSRRHSPGERSQWERISLAPDVELHVRRPLTKETNRAVDRLLVEARRILGEEHR